MKSSKKIPLLYVTLCLLIAACNADSQPVQPERAQPANEVVEKELIDTSGRTIESRFNPPKGYYRKAMPQNSFAHYLRNLPLKPHGSPVRHYDGTIKPKKVHDAVVDMQIGKKDLQQCADATMRLRGEYLYGLKKYDQISFTLTSGFVMDYSKWMEGNRIKVDGRNVYWKKTAGASNTYNDFLNYMEAVFNYASTLSLDKSLKKKNLNAIEAGDIFVIGGSPGHAVIVVDIAENTEGQKVFLLAQSYMPAQEIQVLKNYNNEGMGPWYSAQFTGALETPEYTFHDNDLKGWE